MICPQIIERFELICIDQYQVDHWWNDYKYPQNVCHLSPNAQWQLIRRHEQNNVHHIAQFDKVYFSAVNCINEHREQYQKYPKMSQYINAKVKTWPNGRLIFRVNLRGERANWSFLHSAQSFLPQCKAKCECADCLEHQWNARKYIVSNDTNLSQM